MDRRHHTPGRAVFCAVSLLSFALPAAAAGRLQIEGAWIRTAPPGAMMLAGYARLHNVGDVPLVVNSADSADFGSVSLHQTISDNGVERMRALGDIEIAPGADIDFTPGAKHFMLMRPRRELNAGAKVSIHISTNSGDGATAEFVVRDDAP
jgi:periplasmic copper chaperone A